MLWWTRMESQETGRARQKRDRPPCAMRSLTTLLNAARGNTVVSYNSHLACEAIDAVRNLRMLEAMWFMHVNLSNLLSVCDNAFMNGFPLILGARCAYTMPRGGSVHFVMEGVDH